MRIITVLLLFLSISLSAKHKFIAADTTTKEVFIINESGEKAWSYKAPDKPQDVSILPNGNILLCCKTIVVELTMNKEIVWKFERKGEMHSAQRLADDSTLVGHTSEGKIYFISPEGKVINEFKTTYTTKNKHRIFRRIRQAQDGRIYIGHHGDGVCRIYNPKGEVTGTVTHYKDRCFSAMPMKNETILLTGEERLKIVNHKDEVLWEVSTEELNKKVVALTSAKQLKNGNILVTNWQGHVKKKGRTQPAMIEISSDKKIVWSYDGDKNKCLITMDVFE